MKIEDYLKKAIEKRIEIVKKADWRTAPFWLERLQTAVSNHSPIGLGLIDERLADEYWTIIEAKKLQTA